MVKSPANSFLIYSLPGREEVAVSVFDFRLKLCELVVNE